MSTTRPLAGIPVLGLLFGLAAGTAQAADPVKVGVIQPQSGDCAQWGIPISRGVEMWADEQNGKGGIMSGDGQRHEVVVTKYDNACYTPGEELKAGRRAMADDGVGYLLQTYTPAGRQAIAALTSQYKVLTTSYGAGFLSKEFPYLLGGITGAPTNNMYIVNYILQKHPEVKKVAIVVSKNSQGIAAKAYYEAGIAPFSNRVEIVYNESFEPGAAKDMIGLMTPVIAANPDLIVELGFVPEQKEAMVEAADQLGYTGLFGSEEWPVKLMVDRLGADKIAGRLFSALAVDASEPTFSPVAHKFYEAYVAKYGADQWSPWAAAGYVSMGVIQVGIEKAPSAKPEDVMNTLYGMKTVDHPVFGPSGWGGEEIYGANHHLLTRLPVYTIGKDGSPTVEGVIDAAKWWEENKAAALPALEANGQVYTK